MSRRMSCSLTIDAVRDRSKTVTRRHPATWTNLQPGDRLTLVEKAMGLAKGAKQVVLAEVEIVSNTVEPLMAITQDDIEREGVHANLSPGAWARWWMRSHGLNVDDVDSTLCRRIEWRYLP